MLSPRLFCAVLEFAMSSWRAKAATYGLNVKDGMKALLDLRFADDLLVLATGRDDTIRLLEELVTSLGQVGLKLNMTTQAQPKSSLQTSGKWLGCMLQAAQGGNPSLDLKIKGKVKACRPEGSPFRAQANEMQDFTRSTSVQREKHKILYRPHPMIIRSSLDNPIATAFPDEISLQRCLPSVSRSSSFPWSRAFHANRSILTNHQVSVKDRLTFFHGVVTPVACFAAGHRIILKQKLAALDVAHRKLLCRVVGPPAGMDWSRPWHEILHDWNVTHMLRTTLETWALCGEFTL